MKVICLVVRANNFFCCRLMIEEYNHYVFVSCLLAIPVLIYMV